MNEVSETLRAAIESGAPQRVLLEFIKKPNGQDYTPIVTMSNEELNQGFEMTEYFNSETDLAIGLCPSTEFKFTIFNDTFQYEDFEFGTFRAWLGARIDNGTPASGAKTKTFTGGELPGLYEFTRLGVFISEKPNIIRKQIVDVTANDQMILFDQPMPSGLVQYSDQMNIGILAREMCRHVGVELKARNFMNNDIVVASEPEAFKDATMREVLGWIAEAAGSIARFTRTGKLELTWFNPTNQTYDEHNYSDFSPAWYEVKKIDKLVIRNSDADTEYAGGAGSNSYFIQNNPFLKQGESSTLTAPTITTDPINRTSKVNKVITLYVKAGGAVEYQWQRSTDPTNKSKWANVPANIYVNSKTSAMSFTVQTELAGYSYRCVASNAAGDTPSKYATVTIET